MPLVAKRILGGSTLLKDDRTFDCIKGSGVSLAIAYFMPFFFWGFFFWGGEYTVIGIINTCPNMHEFFRFGGIRLYDC